MDLDRPANTQELARLRDLVQRAGRHEPVQYLVGSWSFFGCEIEVGPSTLIPRPATESLVEEAIRRLRALEGARSEKSELRIADLCTGSGCIAVAIARSIVASRGGRKQLAWQKVGDGAAKDSAGCDRGSNADAMVRVYAVDVVPAAVELARRNVRKLGLDSIVEVLEGDLDMPLVGRALEGSLDVVCANPPYISDAEWAKVPPNVRDYEPASALRGGIDGLDFVRRIVECAPRWLKGGGSLLLEISSSQGDQARAIAGASRFAKIEILPDLEGHPRILAATWPGQ